MLTVVAGTALRAEPTVRSAIVLQLDAGATVLLGRAEPQPAETGAWRNVVVGALQGWVPSDAVRPRGHAVGINPDAAVVQAQSGRPVPRAIASSTGAPAAPRALMLSPAEPRAEVHRYRVNLDGLALRTLPDVNADVLANLIAGDTVVALSEPPRGAWTAVQFGEGDRAIRGWAATQWLLPASAP